MRAVQRRVHRAADDGVRFDEPRADEQQGGDDANGGFNQATHRRRGCFRKRRECPSVAASRGSGAIHDLFYGAAVGRGGCFLTDSAVNTVVSFRQMPAVEGFLRCFGMSPPVGFTVLLKFRCAASHGDAFRPDARSLRNPR